MSKHVGDFYRLNCLHSFKTKSTFDFKILLQFHQYRKSDKTTSVIYADLKSLI